MLHAVGAECVLSQKPLQESTTTAAHYRPTARLTPRSNQAHSLVNDREFVESQARVSVRENISKLSKSSPILLTSFEIGLHKVSRAFTETDSPALCPSMLPEVEDESALSQKPLQERTTAAPNTEKQPDKTPSAQPWKREFVASQARVSVRENISKLSKSLPILTSFESVLHKVSRLHGALSSTTVKSPAIFRSER